MIYPEKVEPRESLGLRRNAPFAASNRALTHCCNNNENSHGGRPSQKNHEISFGTKQLNSHILSLSITPSRLSSHY